MIPVPAEAGKSIKSAAEENEQNRYEMFVNYDKKSLTNQEFALIWFEIKRFKFSGGIFMTYAVIYQSETGNTEEVAHEIFNGLSGKEKSIFNLEEITALPEADVYFIGFGIYNNTCSMKVIDCLDGIERGKIALFATCGFTPTARYKDTIEHGMEVWLPEDAEYLGMYLCQGMVMDEQRAIMKEKLPEAADKMDQMFKKGTSHPDEEDLQAAARFAQRIQQEME